MSVTVTATVCDITGRPDNTRWVFTTPMIVRDAEGDKIVTKRKRAVQPLDGSISVELEPGLAVVEFGDQEWIVEIPDEDASLWEIIATAVSLPPDLPQAALAAAVTTFLDEHPVATMQVEGLTNAGTAGKAALLAETQAQARSAIGAGTSSLALGSTGSTAKAGNWVPAAADVSDSTATGRTVLTGDAAAGRTALGATTLTEAQARIAAWAGADAYIDFTTKPDGDPPGTLDTGQTVDYTLQLVSNRKPRIISGKLCAGAPGSGAEAYYYQAQMGRDCRSAGTDFTLNTADGSTLGVVCLAIWDGMIEAAGTLIPKSPAHITVDTLTGQVTWWVNDGLDNTHLKAVKQWSITPPAFNGTAVWVLDVRLEPEKGIGYLTLPGPTSTGDRIVTLTDGEISSFFTTNFPALPVPTFANMCSGADVFMVEHQCNATANTARMPRFLNMWGNEYRASRDRDRELHIKSVSPAPSVAAHLPAATVQTKTIGTSSATLYTDTGNTVAAAVTVAAGPTGKIDFLIPTLCIEFTGSMDRTVADGAITSGAATLTSATAAFAATDVGRQVVLAGAGPGGGPLIAFIVTYTNSTTVTLSATASATVSGQSLKIGPSEAIIFGRMRETAGTYLSTPNPDVVVRGVAAQRWTGAASFRAEGLTPGDTRTWQLQLSRFTFGDALASVKLGGSSTTQYPSVRVIATPR